MLTLALTPPDILTLAGYWELLILEVVTITNNYWDTEAADGLSTSAGGGATGLTSAQMQAVSGTYPEFLGPSFRLNQGSYPIIYKCDITTLMCTSPSTELLLLQYVDPEAVGQIF